MTKPCIDIYRNEGDEATIVYLSKISLHEDNDPQYISVCIDHIEPIIEELSKFLDESGE